MRAPWPETQVVLLLLLAGCAGNAAPGQTEPPGPPVTDDRFEWTGCDGVIVALDGPSLVYAGTVPAGWEDPFLPTNTIQVILYRCERVSWGPFERGPVFVLQEWHGGFAAPDTCKEGKYTARVMLQSAWFSDPDLVAYARDVHGMPAWFAEFGVGRHDVGAVAEWTWTWAIPGQAESKVAFHDAVGEENHTSHLVRRVYWPNGAGVSFMDFRETFRSDDLDSVTASGALQPPFLHGRAMPSPDFVSALANRKGDAAPNATIAHFRDTACREPS